MRNAEPKATSTQRTDDPARKINASLRKRRAEESPEVKAKRIELQRQCREEESPEVRSKRIENQRQRRA
ncbi:unnamed protein product [Orchesella dallaii]|uniref:Uncharacterized protein n=1 Tax=Orchesella dallaii TaxID=48710 RepID=A0ABP1Q2U8_9HEXA